MSKLSFIFLVGTLVAFAMANDISYGGKSDHTAGGGHGGIGELAANEEVGGGKHAAGHVASGGEHGFDGKHKEHVPAEGEHGFGGPANNKGHNQPTGHHEQNKHHHGY